MSNFRRSAAAVVATLVVALTPVFAYADAGPKDKLSIYDSALLAAVNTVVGSDYGDMSHGQIMSTANQKYQDLVTTLKLGDKKFSRGQLISMLSHLTKPDSGKDDEAKTNSDKHTPTATPTSSNSSTGDEDKGKDGEKGNKGKHKGNGGDNEDSADAPSTQIGAPATPTATAVPTTVTPTATVVPTQSVVPTETAVPTSTMVPTATATPRGHGQGNGNGDH